jgi:hypothetical protein
MDFVRVEGPEVADFCLIVLRKAAVPLETAEFDSDSLADVRQRAKPTLCGPSRRAASGHADYLFRAIDLCRSRRAVLSSADQHDAAPRDILPGVAEPDAECVRDSIAVGRIALQAVGDVRGSPYRHFWHVDQGEAKTIS